MLPKLYQSSTPQCELAGIPEHAGKDCGVGGRAGYLIHLLRSVKMPSWDAGCESGTWRPSVNILLNVESCQGLHPCTSGTGSSHPRNRRSGPVGWGSGVIFQSLYQEISILLLRLPLPPTEPSCSGLLPGHPSQKRQHTGDVPLRSPGQ